MCACASNTHLDIHDIKPELHKMPFIEEQNVHTKYVMNAILKSVETNYAALRVAAGTFVRLCKSK